MYVDVECVVSEVVELCKLLWVFLMLYGMVFLEYFGFYCFDDVVCIEIFDDLMMIVESDVGVLFVIDFVI